MFNFYRLQEKWDVNHTSPIHNKIRHSLSKNSVNSFLHCNRDPAQTDTLLIDS